MHLKFIIDITCVNILIYSDYVDRPTLGTNVKQIASGILREELKSYGQRTFHKRQASGAGPQICTLVNK